LAAPINHFGGGTLVLQHVGRCFQNVAGPVRPGPDTGGIEPAKDVLGTVDQFVDRVFLGLVCRIRQELRPRLEVCGGAYQAVPIDAADRHSYYQPRGGAAWYL
jgi:hypothetical protein